MPQSQGLALADKVRKNDRVTICTVSDGASMEGEAKEAFAAIPGLAAKGRLNPFLLVISDNDTKLSGRISKDAFSMEPTFPAMSALGWNVIHVPEGNDLQAVYLAVESGLAAGAGQSARACLLLVQDGERLRCARDRGKRLRRPRFSAGQRAKRSSILSRRFILATKFPRNWPTGRRPARRLGKKGSRQKSQGRRGAAPRARRQEGQDPGGLAKGAVRAAQEGFPVYSISADVEGSTGMSYFQKSFPDRFVEVGVAEANMISTAAGFPRRVLFLLLTRSASSA